MSQGGDACRLFFALWPDRSLREQIECRTHAAVVSCGGRPVPPRNYHITLLFMGNVRHPMLEQALAMAASLSGSAFELVLDSIQRPTGGHVMWLAAPQPPALAALVGALRSSGLASGIEHSFKPHITLVRNPIRGATEVSIEPLTWHVREFVLVRSQPGAAGSQYSVVERWPLV